jgi:hypothetical protein
MTFKLYTVIAVINEFKMVWTETFVASLRHRIQTLGETENPREMLGLLAEMSVLVFQMLITNPAETSCICCY